MPSEKGGQILEFLLLFLLSVTYFINIKFFSFFRLADLFLFIFVAVVFIKNFFFVFDKISVGWVFIFYLFSGYFWGFLKLPTLNNQNFAFIGKYCIVIFFTMSISSLDLSIRQRRILYNSFLLSFLFLFFWISYLFLTNKIEGRVGFPFSDLQGGLVDAHLFSSVISLLTIFFILKSPDKIDTNKVGLFFWNVFIGCAGAFLALLSGSRTGVLVISLFFAVQLFILIKNFTFKAITKYDWINFFSYLTFFSICLALIINNYSSVIERAFAFHISDSSFQARISKAFQVIQAVLDNGVIFGTGMQAFKVVWIDSGIASVFANVGFLGLVTFVSLIYIFIRNNKLRNSRDSSALNAILFFYFIN